MTTVSTCQVLGGSITLRVPYRLFAIAALLVLVLAGCGGEEKSADEAKADFCSDLNALNTSIDKLEQTRSNPTSTVDELKSARDDVKEKMQAVDDSASDVANANVDQLDDAYDALNKAINDIDDSATLAQAAQSVADEVQQVRAAWLQVLNTAKC